MMILIKSVRLGSDWEVGEQGKHRGRRGEEDVIGEGEVVDDINNGGGEAHVDYKGGDRG